MRRIVWALLSVILLGIIGTVVYGYGHRMRTVKAYYRLERKWSGSTVLAPAEKILESAEPFFLRVGLLGPARIPVENGISFLLDPRDLVPLTILRSGEWQPEIWNAIDPALSPGSVFLDVGAHIGYFSLKAARVVGKTGRVLAFEPNPETLVLLRDNVSANHFDNVTVEPIACTDRPQKLTLYASSKVNTGASSLSHDNAEISPTEAARAFTVEGRPIDDVVKELGLARVDAIKVDVEGAEVIVLKGAIETLKRFHPKVIAEVVPRQLAGFKSTPDELRALLHNAGYTQSRPLNSEETDWEWTSHAPSSVIRVSDTATSTQLIRGFYQLEQNAWRWTAGHFTVAMHPPQKGRAARLSLHFVFPEASLRKLQTMTISANVGSIALQPQTFSTVGKHVYEADIPASALGDDLIQIEFALDHVIPADQSDGRELGIVVSSISLE